VLSHLKKILIWSKKRREWSKQKDIIFSLSKSFIKWQLHTSNNVHSLQDLSKVTNKCICWKTILRLYLKKLKKKTRSVYSLSKIKQTSMITKSIRTIIWKIWRIQNVKHRDLLLKSSLERTFIEWERKKSSKIRVINRKIPERRLLHINLFSFYRQSYLWKLWINRNKSRWGLAQSVLVE